MGTIKNILTGISEHLSAHKDELPKIYWPNVASSETPPDPHLIVDILPSKTISIGINSTDMLSGIIQILINVKKGTNAFTISDISDQILEIFPRNTEIIVNNETKIRIDKKGYSSPPMPNDVWYSIAVSIPYNVIEA